MNPKLAVLTTVVAVAVAAIIVFVVFARSPAADAGRTCRDRGGVVNISDGRPQLVVCGDGKLYVVKH